MRRLRVFGTILVLGMLVHAAAFACPLCNEGLFDPGQAATQSRLAWGYLIGVAALLGVPFLLVAGISVWLVRSAKRMRRFRIGQLTSVAGRDTLQSTRS